MKECNCKAEWSGPNIPGEVEHYVTCPWFDPQPKPAQARVEFGPYRTGSDPVVEPKPVEPKVHVASEKCWCEPELIGDYESEGGVKHYLHKELQ